MSTGTRDGFGSPPVHAVSEGFGPHVLREYALVADGERGCLVGPRGDMAWLCVPAWDSDAVFSTLVGGAGGYAVSPVGRYTWGGSYRPRSLIWDNRWVTTDGIVECGDALAMPAEAGRCVVLRRIRRRLGTGAVRVVLDLRAGFGAEPMVEVRRAEDGTWTARSGGLHLRWTGAPDAHRHGSGPLEVEVVLAPGETRDLVLEVGTAAPGAPPAPAEQLWRATEAAWDRSVPSLAPGILARGDAETAMAVMTGLTSAGGAMVAAATMSLPERAEEGRNYDYRYAWIRDQCYAGLAVAAHGHHGLLDAAVGFVSERLLADGPGLKPAYTVRAGPVPDERSLPGLAGYPGGADKVGNWVNQQFQLDAFGEALEMLAAASALDRLDTGHWDAVQVAVSAIEARWRDPDAGIWEIDNRRWTHSRLTCVSGLRAAAAQAPRTDSGRWSALADTILADVSSDCLRRDGRWQRAPDDPRVDAALLVPLIRSALPADDPRVAATVAAVEVDLVDDEYVYRFRHDERPLGDSEGAFLLCGFALALARHRMGDRLGARALFERNRSACGSPGLFAEEFDIAQRQLRGNLPQAFVHAMMLECCATLAPDGHGR